MAVPINTEDMNVTHHLLWRHYIDWPLSPQLWLTSRIPADTPSAATLLPPSHRQVKAIAFSVITSPITNQPVALRLDLSNREGFDAMFFQTLTDLFENLCRHMVIAVENDAELPASLHLFEEGPRVLWVERKLTDL